MKTMAIQMPGFCRKSAITSRRVRATVAALRSPAPAFSVPGRARAL